MAYTPQLEPMDCTLCELLCMDAVDGTLTPAEDAAFALHVAGCTQCAEMLAEARRGAAWMEMLKGHKPQPPAALLERILAETTGALAPEAIVAPAFIPPAIAPTRSGWLAGLRGRFSFGSRENGAAGYAFSGMHPRFAMTAAMAFFSLALTMNMAGVRLTDLRPGGIHRTFSDARANVTRSVANLRVVHQFESRVDDLRGNDLQHDNPNDPAGPFGENSKSSTKDGGQQ